MGQPRMPHVYLLRHGQTEWSINGRHTGTSDIPLTPHGEKVMKELAKKIVPSIICPEKVGTVYVSPRMRAQRTAELILLGEGEGEGGHKYSKSDYGSFQTSDEIAEWDYGLYEGMLTKDIKKQYKKDWYIWKDGCPPGGVNNTPGESAEQMTERVDRVIGKIRKLHEELMQDPERASKPQDIVLISHGHFSRCFIARWCQLPLEMGYHFQTDAGSLSILGYQHGTLKEPSLIGLNWYSEDRC